MNYIQKLRLLLNKKTKQNLAWLVTFSVFVSIIEALGISAIMPFIDIATNFENIHQNQYYKWLFEFFEFENDINFAIIFGFYLFNEIPSVYTLSGAGLIVISSAIIFVREHQLKKPITLPRQQ